MRRISLILTGAVLCAVIAFSGTAAAKGGPKTCTTHSKNVIGKTVKGTLTSRDVNKVQAEYATCGYAKKVMNRILALRVEEPKSVIGFYCTPTVLATAPDKVKYKCEFKGADTPMYVRLVFQVKYNLD